MNNTTITDCRIQNKIDTETNWATNNPTLLNGEFAIVIMANGEVKLKVGDGVKTYTELAFIDQSTQDTLNQLKSMHKTLGVADNINSWWCNPRCIYNELRDTVYVGGVSREGMRKICMYDLRNGTTDYITLKNTTQDDHNTPAFLLEEDKPPIVAYSDHTKEPHVYIRVSNGLPFDIKPLEDDALEKQISFVKTGESTSGKCSYTSLIRKPNSDTILLFVRFGSKIRMIRSDDWGTTWGEPVVFVDLPYATFSKSLDGKTINYVSCSHAIENGPMIYIVKINLETGDVYGTNNTIITNIWNDFIPISAKNTGDGVTATSIRAQQVHRSWLFNVRVFDVSYDGSCIASMKIARYKEEQVFNGEIILTEDEATVTTSEDGTTVIEYTGYATPSTDRGELILPNRGGMYGVFRYNGSSWVFEEIVNSGKPIGYYKSLYAGGMAMINNNEVVLCREENDIWYTERWTRSNEGVWSKAEVIEESSVKLGRPQIPWGSSGKNIYTYNNYQLYSNDSYNFYYGDQIVKKPNL